MSKNKEEFFNLIQKSKKILVFVSDEKSFHLLSGATALCLLLQKLQKNCVLFLKNPLPEKLSYLEKPEKILSNLSGARDFIIIFNTNKNKILSVQTKEKENEYEIIVTPEKGAINPKDFSFVPAQFKYDLLIILGAESLDKMGKTYYENTDLFFEVPKINIDNHTSNENFGQVNLVNITASSPTEIIAGIALEKYEKVINQPIAEALLSGIISATESFQKSTTTPGALTLSANLMKYKADQAKIIRYLYKTKSLSFLKLWGRVMARLAWNEKNKLIWSLISQEDFIQSHCIKEDIPLVLSEIEKNFSHGKIFAIIYSFDKNKTVIAIKTKEEELLSFLSKENPLYENETTLLEFENKDILETEKYLLEKIEKNSK